MRRKNPGLILVVFLVVVPGLSAAEESAARRGHDVMLHRPFNPPVWSRSAYDNAWKQWGLKEKPAEYDEAFRRRYGLHAAPFDNHGLPLGLIESKGLLTTGIVNNCLLCHAGTVAGQTVIGLANSTLDLQGLFEDLTAADHMPLKPPFQFSIVRGTASPVSPLAFLMAFRDTELNVRKAAFGTPPPDVASDPPAWWLIKRKKTRDWTGAIDARSTRVDLVNLLTPFNSGDYIKQQAAAFADISAFLLTIQPPKYPFAVDRALAERGRPVFVDNCAKCHGTYGPDGSYPNRVVSLDTLGTDPLLAQTLRPEFVKFFNESWLAREPGPDGKPYQVRETDGYQAPPLDGVWATAPYFHNSSAPTLYHVLDSKSRPRYFTRTYGTAREDYDPVRVGLKIKVLDSAPDPRLPGRERRAVYNTTRPGCGNGGHTFGDKLTEEQRAAVLEYLKTL